MDNVREMAAEGFDIQIEEIARESVLSSTAPA